MPDNDIEKELKDSADKITVKSFSERWDNIKDRLSVDEVNQEILVESPVLAGYERTAFKSTDSRKTKLLIVALSFAVCCILVLSIVLPLTLRKTDKEPSYFSPSDITRLIVDNDQFFDAFNNNGFETIDLSGYKIENCILLATVDGQLKGGECTVVNEEWLVYIIFYDFSVDPFDFDYFEAGYEVYTVGSTEIKYSTEYDGTTYVTDARARFKNNYNELKIYSLYDNRFEIFEKLFS